MDRRIKYTKKIIKESFLTILEEKDIKKITVSELCKLADVNRATFYRYYLDVYDLFDKIQIEFVEDLKNAIGNEPNNYTIPSFCNGLLKVLEEQKKLAKLIFSSNNNLVFLNDILEIIYQNCKTNWKKKYNNLDDEDIEYAAVFIFNGALGIINFWIKNDFKNDIYEISSIIDKLCSDGINKFIKNRD